MQSFEDFQLHNLFRYSVKEYKTRDPHLHRLAKLPFSYVSSLILEPHFTQPGIYLLTGGRQVGKTTFIKQFILSLLEKENVPTANILFLPGELIDSHHVLIRLVETFTKPNELQFLFVDEINYIPDWDKGIKYLADGGFFENTVVILTGSDSFILRTAMKRFAGRRGKADKVDYIFYPLSYKEFVLLKNPALKTVCEALDASLLTDMNTVYISAHSELMTLLDEYLVHGGYLPAIADFWKEKTIHPGTLRTYIEWIVGDMLKFRKTEKHVFEILKGILSSYSSQISWHSLLKYLSIQHHQTVSDYCQLLQDIHVIYIVEALNENTLMAAPKKNKKIYFQDPFVYHAATAFIEKNLTFSLVMSTLESPTKKSSLVEGVVISHCKKNAETFYVKGKNGEVDVAVIRGNRFAPIEVKWTSQLRLEELKQIQQYQNGLVLWNRAEVRFVEQTPVVPLPAFLLKEW